MLFSVEPKESLAELFGRDEEVRKFLSCVDKERMIIVTGLRRVGKSSLVLAGLNSLNRGYIFIDVRKIYDNVSRRVASEKLYEEIRLNLLRIDRIYHIKDIIKRFDVSLEYPVRISLSRENAIKDLSNIFSALNEIGLDRGKPIPVVFDEAQYLRFSTIGLRPLLAHIYDYMKGLVLIFTGSEVGLLEDFLGIDNPKSELYGRYYCSIELKPFDEEKSREFLRKGFAEFDLSVDEGLISKAVSELDGIVGWLVYFGKLYLEKRSAEVILEVKELGSRLVKEELRELFARSQFYSIIMKGIAVMGNARWKNIMDYVIAKTGRRISNTTLSRDLRKLMKMGFIEKVNDEYKITDPIVRYTLLKEGV